MKRFRAKFLRTAEYEFEAADVDSAHRTAVETFAAQVGSEDWSGKHIKATLYTLEEIDNDSSIEGPGPNAA